MKKWAFCSFFYLRIRNLRNRNVILNRAKDYYETDKKKRLREQARDKYRNLSEEDKNKKREYVRKDTIIYLKKRNKN